jgi:hypothetical protein
VVLAKDYDGKEFDLVTCFDCLHDMGDPAGAAAHIRQSLKSDGTWMIVEPIAGDSLEQNLNPVGRLYYAGSTMICLPTSRSQEVGAALGAQAGEKKLREASTAAVSPGYAGPPRRLLISSWRRGRKQIQRLTTADPLPLRTAERPPSGRAFC